MQSTLLQELTKITNFSPPLIHVLEKLAKIPIGRYSESFTKQVEHHLVSLTCQNKNLLHYKYLQDKGNNERCLAYIIEVLSRTTKASKGSRQNIAGLFLSHILSHTSCYISYYTFLGVLENVPEIFDFVELGKLKQINTRIQKHQNPHDLKMLHSIQIDPAQVFVPEHIEICQRNLDAYLRQKQKPKKSSKGTKNNESNQKNISKFKIPPLILPTSKTTNTSRYSAISRDQKRKGLSDLKKLGSALGEGFISVELGCLLANKRTKQVQEFSQNQSFRKNCLNKLEIIETERMNSSRLSIMNLEMNRNLQGEGHDQETLQNSKRYYRKVLTANMNVCIRKLKYESSETPRQHSIQKSRKKTRTEPKKTYQSGLAEVQHHETIEIVKQIIDMALIGIVSLTSKDASQPKNNYSSLGTQPDIFYFLKKNMRTLSETVQELMKTIHSNTQKLHMHFLINRGKFSSSYHYDIEQETQVVEDDFLSPAKIKINEPMRLRGAFRETNLSKAKKISDPILFWLGSWLQSLLESADLNHPLFEFYESNLLKTMSFYLNQCCSQSKISHYYLAEYLFPILLLIKRQIIELSHPYLAQVSNLAFGHSNVSVGSKPMSKIKSGESSCDNFPLFCTNSEIFQYFIEVISSMLLSGNKQVEKMLSHIFFKNVYFMEVLQGYVQWLFKEEKIEAIVGVLGFYRRAVEVYTVHALLAVKKNPNHSTFEHNKNCTYISFIYQHLENYLCPKNGCIAKVLHKYESHISPVSLEQLDEEQNGILSSDHRQSIQSGTHISSTTPKAIHNFLHQIFLFLAEIYNLTTPALITSESPLILEEQTASFYIRYSIMNFIKLYSLITVSELVNINSGKETDQFDYLLSTKQSPHSAPKVNTKQIFMIDFLKLLTSISINRTPELAKKIRQYRVLEFFVREIELEFSVHENVEKYIKKAVDVKSIDEIMKDKFEQERKKKKSTEKNKFRESNQQAQFVDPKMLLLDLTGGQSKDKGKKGQSAPKKKVPSLNLTGEVLKKQEEAQEVEKPKEQGKGKKLVPALKIPIKTEESQNNSKDSKKERGSKGYLDDLLEQIMIKDSNPSKKKKSFKTQLGLKLEKLTEKEVTQRSNATQKVSSERNIIYSTERKIRKIYSSKLLHAESILLILSLVLYKGQLDPMYCDQMPIIQGKLNILYILHYHLNHPSNKSIIPLLAENVSKIKPYLAGQRLLKLLSSSFTNLNQYQEWAKINAGAFGVVMTASTGLEEPAEVAVKQMNFPKSIYERCVLHDIFTEITCLQMFRLQDRVTRMYNYGIVDNTYAIIMKKYTCSLRDWRLGLVQNAETRLYPPTLPNILAIFYDILKGLKMLHQQNVTHYDIKGDNIMLDFKPNHDPKLPPTVEVVFGDFGVCKIFEDEQDELDTKSRGTECIKSPQMLTLTLKNKKQADNFDRRKKIGTTKASDIWSLGCMLYEIVTGQFLFNSNDWVKFFMQVTTEENPLLTPANEDKMKNNVYLIDFIKYILIRDPTHRPSIQNILSRFENLYELLVSNPDRTASADLRLIKKKTIDELVHGYLKFMSMQEGERASRQTGKAKRPKTEGELGKTGQVMGIFNSKYAGKMMKIMEDIYFCEKESYLTVYEDRIKQEGITHVIIEEGANVNRDLFKVLSIQANQCDGSLIYRLCPRVSDMLRQVLLFKGKLLFVNNETNYCINLLIFTLSYWFRCSAYETWCLINTQILTFPTFTSDIATMSKGLSILRAIEQQVSCFPKLQCICGSVTIIVRKFQEKKGEMRICKCKKKMNETGCFTKNCPKYLEFIKKRYNIAWDHLTWALINQEQLITPLFSSSSRDQAKTQIMLNSADPLSNMITDESQSPVWRILQCKVCEMWILGNNCESGETWVILNNLIKSSRQGIMIPNAQQDYKAKTPALNYYTLSKLHMTSQS